jgi:DNA invertase Pin-like site-specific DNA recombinase
MNDERRVLRAAIYCRKSSEEGLEQSFNSLHAQREACEAFVTSLRQEGWRILPAQYDDGGFSGGTMDRPALQQLLRDVIGGKVNIIVVYKVDRLTRSLADFAKMIEVLDANGVSFVSVTQQFNTTSSMGRLTLNVLLSFAQFEREVTGERIRDKIAASKKKGMWMGGFPPLGYDVKGRKLVPNPKEATLVRSIFTLYAELGSVATLKAHLDRTNIRSKSWKSRSGIRHGGARFSRGALYELLLNRLYIGEVRHRKLWYPGLHKEIVPREVWDRAQSQMESNREHRSFRIRTHSSSLLTGLIEDKNGNSFTPSFTVKNKKRYRYYVSRAAIETPGTTVPGPTRCPAQELETVVLDRVQSFLNSETELFHEYQNAEPDESGQRLIPAAKSLASCWPELGPSEIQEFMDSCVYRVIVEENRVEVLLDKAALSLRLLEGATGKIDRSLPDDNRDVIRLPAVVRLKRCGGEMCLVLPAPTGESKVCPRPTSSLIKAVARAHKWYDLLRIGEVNNLTSLAAKLGLGDRYVSRVLPFAFLAPDIVESILDGTQPPHLTFAKMARNIPQSWVEQRVRFGFPPVLSR